MEKEFKERVGWICPKCKAVLSPDLLYCPFCIEDLKREQEDKEEDSDFFTALMKKYFS